MTLSTLFFQSHIDQWLYLIVATALTTFFYFRFWNLIPKNMHFYIVSFASLYTLIGLLGGALVGVSEADWLLQLQPQGGYRILSTEKISWPLYWFLLYLPLWLFPLAITSVFHVLPSPKEVENKKIAFRMDFTVITFLALVFAVTFRNYPMNRFVDWILGGGDFSQMIQQRGQVLSSLNYFSLNIFYVLAPAFFASLCFRLLKDRKWYFLFFAPFTLVLILAFTILTYQKLLFFMTLLVAGGLLFYKKVLPVALVAVSAVAMPGLLVLLSLLSNNPYGFVEVFAHFILRTGSAISYYTAYISQSYYFPGYDMPLDGRTIKDNVEVFRYMFPVSSWKGGTSSAPFHLRSWFQGGLLFVLVEFVIVGVLINGIQRLGSFFNEGRVYFESLSLVFFFYLCQTSLKDCLVSSYGMVLSLLFFIFIFDLNRRVYAKSN